MLEEDPRANTGHDVRTGMLDNESVEFVARRLIIQLAPAPPGTSPQEQVDAALAALPAGSALLRGPSATGRLVVVLPEADDSIESMMGDAQRVAVSEAIAFAEPDVVDHAQIVPNDPRYPQQWAPAAVNAELAWDLQTGAANVLIGIIDSGISIEAGGLSHDDLRDTTRITLGTDFVDGGTPTDLNGHGTHVAGIAAAAGNNSIGVAGMNWGSPIYVCRTLDAAGNGSSADFADAVEEITDFAVAHSLKAVINYSGGGANNLTKQQACQYASDNGMLVVAAAGNDSAGPVIWPAAYSTTITGVIAVGSTDQGDIVSSFSNVGPEVSVVAPGRNILSTLPTYSVSPTMPLNYGTLSGTSMATPLVTGLAALMWSRHPGHTNARIKQSLQDTAVKLGAAAFDNTWGHGRVDALAAVTSGDLVIGPSLLRACTTTIFACQPSRLCPSKVTICASAVTLCPSRLPVLCPSTRITICAPVSQLSGACGPSRLGVCPSLLDGCSSALGCPSDLICGPQIPGRLESNPEPFRVSAQLRRLQEQHSGTAGSEDGGEADWFYLDDDGNLHGV